ncbi:MAG: hypothetical protein P8Q97_11155 [Myxococcota bacterium]|jgi:hypothetical protein|nr:hypothetical protein [Myxococcota bacterium]
MLSDSSTAPAQSSPIPSREEKRRSPLARRGRAWVLCSLILGLLYTPLALAEEGDGGAQAKSPMEQQVRDQLGRLPSGEEGVSQIMTELDEDLALSPEQQTDVREVVTDGVADLQKLRSRFESGELTAMAFGVQVQMQLRKMGDLIDPLLDPEQQVKYKSMRQKQRQEMMKAMRKQRMEAGKTQ